MWYKYLTTKTFGLTSFANSFCVMYTQLNVGSTGILEVEGVLRWLTRVFLRLVCARYRRLLNVSINHAFTNDASNPKKEGNHPALERR